MNNKYDKSINYSLNVVKCLAIFAVICLHCNLIDYGREGLIIDALSRFAVPYFFLISGYFSLFLNREKSLIKYKDRSYKLIKLLIISEILYFLFDVFIFKYYTLYEALHLITVEQIFNTIVFNEYIFGIHLWFIAALLYCYIFYYILGKFKFNYQKLYVYVPILLISNLMIGEVALYMGLCVPLNYYRNFLLMGLPFFILGYYIHDNQEKITSILSNRNLILIIIGSCFLTVIEALIVGNAEVFLGTIILATSLFIWCVKNPNKLNFKIVGFIGGKLYALIYILHLIVVLMLRVYGINYRYFNPIIVFILTSFISFLIYETKLLMNRVLKKKI